MNPCVAYISSPLFKISKPKFMALYYGKHKVQNYDAWRPHFDADQERIHSVGAKCLSVLRSTADPNDVHFVFDVPDMAAFLGVLQTPETAEIMQKTGVLEQPVIYRLEDLQPH
jgi:hypothetical protein